MLLIELLDIGGEDSDDRRYRHLPPRQRSASEVADGSAE